MQIRDALGKCLFACREAQRVMFGKLSLGGRISNLFLGRRNLVLEGAVTAGSVPLLFNEDCSSA